MQSLEILFINILSMSTIASIIFVFICLARKLIKNKVDLKKSSLLWIIFIFVLMIPLNFQSKLSFKNYIQIDKKFTLESSDIFYDNALEDEEISIQSKENGLLASKEIVSFAWLLIALILITKDVILYYYINKNNFGCIPKNVVNIFEESKKSLGISKDIKLVMQEKIKTPSIYGIFNTKILITKEILNFSDKEQKCIFIHELTHYKNKHHLLYFSFNVIEKIHWFNPIVKIAFKMIKEDLEIITDCSVLNSNINLKEYCKTILKVATICSMKDYKVPTICSGKKEIERRIKQMKSSCSYNKASLVLLVMIILVISLITVSLASDKVILNEENYNFNDEVEETIENEVSVEYICPLEDFTVSLNFGTRIHPITREERFHSGIDLKAEQGTKVFATADGTVQNASYDSSKGNYIEIIHKDGSVSAYHHGLEIFVKVGDRVKAGDEIMSVGSTGLATGAHLHFEIRNKVGEYLDVNKMFEK